MNETRQPRATPSLAWLLKEAAALWPERRAANETIDFSLSKFPSGWRFSVTNSWHKWFDAGLQKDFGLYATPEAAVSAFLEYVATNKIDVRRLTE